ncbi:hypothetical protein AOL_s00140g64 [Orbilia oligospora ATCC 24927]|uniref:Peptidase M20 dimerisation domain-containing protein n=1 Tax=Arthrobotrys oligospora (strain ATCC 24927 / CBS 115.81 / DSM 1491) TaxID=756982 RepID=G1XM95_ARTOA|nr:hypothetical protein AOL_s00140g64 [Orbilia oligospora ATCC 24927]EGX45748.1 hypothetical protein AOL_s00140g64 [Orbilia oligospora ATCC 24927]
MGNPEVLLPKDSKDLAGQKTFSHGCFQDGRYRKYILNFLGLLAVSMLGVTLYRGYISSLDPGPFKICQMGALEYRGKPLGTHGPRNKPRRQNIEKLCPRIEPIYPEINTPGLSRAIASLQSPDFLFRSAKTLGDAIKVRTAVYDDFGDVGRDDRWDRMGRFHDYLHSAFPAVSRHLTVKSVNEYGLVYEWGGSDEDLPPILLAAHQDVVPIDQETLEQWEHHPYSGHFDGNDVWGRGALDDKNQLVAIMETINLLIRGGFKPARTIVLAFGFDEETGGDQGAHYIGEYLLDTYGEDGFSIIIDEGSSMQSEFGSDIMVISTAEKGFMNQEITIKMRGGHSSIPPPHSSIGIISEIVVALESHRFERVFSDDNPLFDFLACSAAHAKDFPKELYDYIVQDEKQALADALVKLNPRFDADLRSTTAVTTICGGTKINALPEYVTLGMNHRIRRGSSISEVTNATAGLVSSIAKKHGLQFIAYPEQKKNYPESSITIEIKNQREPSPLTSSRVDIPSAFKLVAGNTRAVFGENLVVTAGLNMGNTDTFWYTKLSKNIFRYAPMPVVKKNMHGVNERVPIKGHLAMVEWFFHFILLTSEVEEYWFL